MSFLKLPVHLSPELIYMTLSYLDKTHDFQTLVACTLVNRQWKRPSQDRLFSVISVHLADRQEVDDDDDSMMIDGAVGGDADDRQYEHFADLIKAFEQSPRLIAHTSSVSITLHPSSTPGPAWDHLFPLVTKFIEITQHARCYELGGLFSHPTLWQESGVVDAVRQLIETATLKKISFTKCGLTSVKAITSLGTNTSRKIPSTIVLSQIYDDYTDDQIVERYWKWTTSNFKILNTSFAVASRILCAKPQDITLNECLTLDLIDDTELDKFMDLISCSLKQLKISIKFPRTSLNQVLIDMGPFDALRHLSIRCAWGLTDGCNYESVYNMLDTFSTSNQLESLEFFSESFLGTTPLSLRMDTSDIEPLRQVDQLLATQERFPCLETVRMLEGCQQYQGEFNEYLASLQWHMQSLIARGMLEFRHEIQTTLDS